MHSAPILGARLLVLASLAILAVVYLARTTTSARLTHTTVAPILPAPTRPGPSLALAT